VVRGRARGLGGAATAAIDGDRIAAAPCPRGGCYHKQEQVNESRHGGLPAI